MKQCIFQQNTIKVPEGNSWQMLLPLRTAKWHGSELETETIDYRALEDVQVLIDGEEYNDWQMTEDGPLVNMPAGRFEVGAHNTVLTALYFGVEVKASYFENFTIVKWSFESNVGEHLQDSPLVSSPAYIYIGITDDQELEELKQQYREATAACETARLAYEAAKEELEEKAEQLNDVAQQSTLVEGIAAQAKDSTVAKQATLVTKAAAIIEAISGIHIDIPEDIATEEDVTAAKQAILEALSHIDIDTSDLAKEATLGAAPIGSDKNTVFQYLAAILENIEGQSGGDPDIPEGVADRLAMIIEFFGIKPIDNYTFITDQQITDTLEDIWDNMNA